MFEIASELEHEFEPRREWPSSSFALREQFAKPEVSVRKISTKMRFDDRVDELALRRDESRSRLWLLFSSVVTAVERERIVCVGFVWVLRDLRKRDSRELLRTVAEGS